MLGYAIVARLPFEAELQAIGVHPEQRRSGAGRALMEVVLSTARGWLSERLLLEVRVSNLSAIRSTSAAGLAKTDGAKATTHRYRRKPPPA
ncbi:GNAT family N-acetyltransferase [Halomonas sp. PA16-9]|uniref:GNAT family N-acetyltransferase n=1 Tax=Halomonas sp. PA16-9 TaxID=2576841 RepID=UPI0030EE424B